MNRLDRRLAWFIGGLALAMLAWLLAIISVIVFTLDTTERSSFIAMLEPRIALVIFVSLLAFGGAAYSLRQAFNAYVVASARLHDQVQVRLNHPDAKAQALATDGSDEVKALAGVLDTLLQEREHLRDDMDRQVALTSLGIEQERNRLAALMAELTQSVVVCNLDGRVLLYNARARLQFRALSAAPALAGGAELIGLGRSIHTVIDSAMLAHALDSIGQRLRRGSANPTAQFVTTTQAGQLLRVQMAAVRDVQADDGDESDVLAGYILMLDNITREFEQESARDRLLHDLTHGSRAALANLQAAVEMLDYPDLEPAMREQFQAVIRDEVMALSERVKRVADDESASVRTRWPLEDMLATDLIGAVRRRFAIDAEQTSSGGMADPQGHDRPPCTDAADEIEAGLWLKVDSYSLLHSLVALVTRLCSEVTASRFGFTLARSGQHARLELAWQGGGLDAREADSLLNEHIAIGPQPATLSMHEVAQRHGGEVWFERLDSPDSHRFCLLLPLATDRDDAAQAASSEIDSRPEYYDFNLFRITALTESLDEHPLASLAYTVFDTETTGLNPSEGDEIIQIGATRIVNSRLLTTERFDQLINPLRPVPAASIPIHGIAPEALIGQPTIAEVLPAFHAFAQDTVLVAHNAAFDMKFLDIKVESTGVRFEQPVLDTLLLSAWLQPDQPSHSLEAIAQRLGLSVTGRHTAIGDAQLTAEIFLRLIGLLAQRGIQTLGQAREISRSTWYARLRY